MGRASPITRSTSWPTSTTACATQNAAPTPRCQAPITPKTTGWPDGASGPSPPLTSTALLLRVEILRFCFGSDIRFRPVLSEAPRPESLDALFEIEERVTGPCMYYARITQEPLDRPGMAWSSPIWIDAG